MFGQLGELGKVLIAIFAPVTSVHLLVFLQLRWKLKSRLALVTREILGFMAQLVHVAISFAREDRTTAVYATWEAFFCGF